MENRDYAKRAADYLTEAERMARSAAATIRIIGDEATSERIAKLAEGLEEEEIEIREKVNPSKG